MLQAAVSCLCAFCVKVGFVLIKCRSSSRPDFVLNVLLHHLFLRFIAVVNSDSSLWKSTVPSSVKGLRGSCVVIPCSFSYPNPREKPTQFKGIWMDDKVTIFHPQHSEIQQNYQTRTKLLGDVQNKNCTLMIDPLQASDTGPFRFRIEMKDFDNYSYSEKVSISVLSK